MVDASNYPAGLRWRTNKNLKLFAFFKNNNSPLLQERFHKSTREKRSFPLKEDHERPRFYRLLSQHRLHAGHFDHVKGGP
jgi:hypothetical protein